MPNGVGIQATYLIGERVHLGVGLLDGDARFEARREVQPLVRVVVRRELPRLESEGRPDVGCSVEEPAKTRRHHAENRVALRVELHRLADNATLGPVNALPETITDDDDVILTRLVFVASKDPA